MRKSPLSDDEWIASVAAKPTKCGTCRDAGLTVLRRLAAAIIESKAKHVTLKAIYEKLSKDVDGFGKRVGFDAFRLHMSNHEPEWKRFRAGS